MKDHEIEYIRRKSKRISNAPNIAFLQTQPELMMHLWMKGSTDPEALRWANRAWKRIKELK